MAGFERYSSVPPLTRRGAAAVGAARLEETFGARPVLACVQPCDDRPSAICAIAEDRPARARMPARLNHSVVWSSDAGRAALILAGMLGLPAPRLFGRFSVVDLSNGVSLDFADCPISTQAQHLAFLISEDGFDGVLGRVRQRGLDHWADPLNRRPSEIALDDGGRGVYSPDPDGHLLEVVTRPYGGDR